MSKAYIRSARGGAFDVTVCSTMRLLTAAGVLCAVLWGMVAAAMTA